MRCYEDQLFDNVLQIVLCSAKSGAQNKAACMKTRVYQVDPSAQNAD